MQQKNAEQAACRQIIEAIMSGAITDSKKLNAVKKKASIDYGLSSLLSNSDILRFAASDEEKDIINEILQKKPVRTVSGVAVIAAMTSPSKCPHGLCIMCPGGPDSRFVSPQSYMGKEPAARRAFQCNFDPYMQVTARLSQLKQIGHPIDKAELILMGGTFTARSLCYQEWFVKRCVEAMNDFENGATISANQKNYMYLEDVLKANEQAKIRNVGTTAETRPDWAGKEHIDVLLSLGVTKVELGIQSTYDFVLSGIKRGHRVKDSIAANRMLRDSGLKVGFHMMPGLPGSSFETDLNAFAALFEDPNFRPDYLKIYPTLVTEGTDLHRMYESGQYQPFDGDAAVELLSGIKAILPKWVRLQRIQRDIPADQIIAGIRKSNVRQLAEKRLEEKGKKCRCIRCREVGHMGLKGIRTSPEDIRLVCETYEACKGLEHFLSFEDVKKDILIGFLRLRFPFSPHRPELQDAALVRELHVYGPLVPVGEGPEYLAGNDNKWQHRGFGEELLKEAERKAKDAGFRKLAVTSGIGAREYYRRFGFELEGVYMVKNLENLDL